MNKNSAKIKEGEVKAMTRLNRTWLGPGGLGKGINQLLTQSATWRGEKTCGALSVTQGQRICEDSATSGRKEHKKQKKHRQKGSDRRVGDGRGSFCEMEVPGGELLQ